MKHFRTVPVFVSIFTANLLATSQILHAQELGSVTDVDGNTYITIMIGNNRWMAENLRVTKFSDGTPIEMVPFGERKNSPYLRWYDNDINSENSKAFGALYSWDAVSQKNVCPDNWHVSTLEEWSRLINNYPISDKSLGEKDGKYAGYSLRMAGDEYWPDNQNANNSSGFSALPGGWVDVGGAKINWLGERAAWWSPDQNYTLPAFGKVAMADDGAWMGDASVLDVLTVRCVENPGVEASKTPEAAPEVASAPVPETDPNTPAVVAPAEPETASSAPADSLSSSSVFETISMMKGKYPEGMDWTDDNVITDKRGMWSGCWGFAADVMSAVYGPDRIEERYTDLSKTKAGDMLRMNDNTHSVIVLAIEGDTFTFAEGNYGGKIHWGRTMLRDEVQQNFDFGITNTRGN